MECDASFFVSHMLFLSLSLSLAPSISFFRKHISKVGGRLSSLCRAQCVTSRGWV